MNERIQNGTELYHHGILGQKWGVRRFQNADGTRTAAGKKRYSDKAERKAARAERREAKKQIKRDYKEAKRLNRDIGSALYEIRNNNADNKLYSDAVNKAADFVKSNPQYILTPNHEYDVSSTAEAIATGMGGIFYTTASGMGIEAAKGTDAYKYGKSKMHREIAIVGGAYIASVAIPLAIAAREGLL